MGRPIWILSAADLTLFKVLFFRGKDLVDVERMLALLGVPLDRNYVRVWLVECVGADDVRVARWDRLCVDLPPA